MAISPTSKPIPAPIAPPAIPKRLPIAAPVNNAPKAIKTPFLKVKPFFIASLIPSTNKEMPSTTAPILAASPPNIKTSPPMITAAAVKSFITLAQFTPFLHAFIYSVIYKKAPDISIVIP